MKKKNLIPILMTLLLATAVLFSGCDADDTSSSAEGSYDDTSFAMGTVVNQTVYSDDKEITSEVIKILTDVEKEYISWREENSDIGKINENTAGGNAIGVSEETVDYIEKALAIASDSDGAFDPTIGKLSRLWDFESGAAEVPDKSEIQKLMEGTGYENITASDDKVTMSNDASIDLGAMGKGIGADEIQAYLDERSDVKGFLINIGGSSILTYGEKDSGEPWKVAVLDPRSEEGYLGSITLDDTYHVSTSGDYEKYFEVDGKRYHHILDPSTGYPAESGLISVTIVADNGATCDALSTASFVLGRQKAEKLLEKYKADAIFVDEEKNVYITDGLKERFELMAEGYLLSE